MNHEDSNEMARYNVKTNRKSKNKNGQFQNSQSPSYNKYNSHSRFDARNNFLRNVDNIQRVPSILNNGIFEETKSKKQKNKNSKDKSGSDSNKNFNNKIEKHQRGKQRSFLDENISASLFHKSEKHQHYMKALNKSFKDNNPSNSDDDATDKISQKNDSELFYFDIMGNLSSTSLTNLSSTSHESILGKRNQTVVDLLDSDVEVTYIEKDGKTSKGAASTLRKDSVETQLEKLFNHSSRSRSINRSSEVSDSRKFKRSKIPSREGVNCNNLSKNQDDVIDLSYDDIFKQLNESFEQKRMNKSKECPDLTNISSNSNDDSDVTYIEVHNELNAIISSEKKRKTSKESSDLESVESQMSKNDNNMIDLNINKTSSIKSTGKKKVKGYPVYDLDISQSLDETVGVSSWVKESSKFKDKKQKEYPKINPDSISNNEVNNVITAKKKKKKTLNLELTDPQTSEIAGQMEDVENIGNFSSKDVSTKSKKKKKKVKEYEEEPDETLKSYIDIGHGSNPVQMSDNLFKSKKKKDTSKNSDIDLENAKYCSKNLEISYVDMDNELNDSILFKKKKKKSKKHLDFDLTDSQSSTNINELVEASNLDNTRSIKESIISGHKKKKAKRDCNLVETDNNDSQNSPGKLHVNGQFNGLVTSKKKKKKLDESIDVESTDILDEDNNIVSNDLLTVKKKKKKSKEYATIEQPYSKCRKNDLSIPTDKKKKIKEDPNINLEDIDNKYSQDSVEMLDVLSSNSHNQVNDFSKSKKKKKKSKKYADSDLENTDLHENTDDNNIFVSKKKKKKLNDSIDVESNILDDDNNSVLNDLLTVTKKKKKSKECPDLELPHSKTGKNDSSKSTENKKKVKEDPSIKLEDIAVINSVDQVNDFSISKKKKKKSKKHLDSDLENIENQYNKKTDENLHESTDKKKTKTAYDYSKLDLANSNNCIQNSNILYISNDNDVDDLITFKRKKKKSKKRVDLELSDSTSSNMLDNNMDVSNMSQLNEPNQSRNKNKKSQEDSNVDITDVFNNQSQNSINQLTEATETLYDSADNNCNKKKKKSKEYVDLENTSTCRQNSNVSHVTIEDNLNDVFSSKKKNKPKQTLDLEILDYQSSKNADKVETVSNNHNSKSRNKMKKIKNYPNVELTDMDNVGSLNSAEMLDSPSSIRHNKLTKTDKMLYDSTNNSLSRNSNEMAHLSSIDNHSLSNVPIIYKKKKRSQEFSDYDLENINSNLSQNSNFSHSSQESDLTMTKKKKPKETLDLEFLDSQSSEIADKIENVSNNNKKKIKKYPKFELTDIDNSGSQNSVEILDAVSDNSHNSLIKTDDNLYDSTNNNTSENSSQMPHISPIDNHITSNVSIVSKKKKRSQEYSDIDLENSSIENDLIPTKKKKKKSKETLDLESLDSQSSKIELTDVDNIGSQNSTGMLDISPSINYNQVNDLTKSKKKKSKEYSDLNWSGVENRCTEKPIEVSDASFSDNISSHGQCSASIKSKKKQKTSNDCSQMSNDEQQEIGSEFEISQKYINKNAKDTSSETCTPKKRKINTLQNTQLEEREQTQETELSNTTYKSLDTSTPTKKRKTAAELSNLNVVNSDFESPIIISHRKGKKRKANERDDFTSGEDSCESSNSPTSKKRKKVKRSLIDGNGSRDLESVSILFGVNCSQESEREPVANLDSSECLSISTKNKKPKIKLENSDTDDLNLLNHSNNIESNDSECTEDFEKETSVLNQKSEPCYSPGRFEKEFKIRSPHNIPTSYTSDTEQPTSDNISNTVPKAKRYPIEKHSKLDYLLKIVSDKMKKAPRHLIEDRLGVNKQMVSEDAHKSGTDANSLRQEKDIQDMTPLLFSDYIKRENRDESAIKNSDNCDTDIEPDKSLQSKNKQTSIKPIYQHVYFSSEDENEHSEVEAQEDDDQNENSFTKLDEEHELTEIAQLEIQLPSGDIPTLHDIVRPSKPTQDELKLAKKLNAKTGRFSKAEDDIIRTNWQSFCETHNLTVRPSAFFKLPKSLSVPEKIKFLQYLSHGLNDRVPSRVYMRFQRIFAEKLKIGNYTMKEDKQIIDFLRNSTTSKPHHELAILLNRTARSIEARVKKLSRLEPDQKILWTVDKAERLIQAIMEVKGIRNVEDLEQISLTTNEWKEVSSVLDIPVDKVKRAWTVTIHPKLFETENLITVRKDLIKLMLVNNETDIKTINWEKYAEHFEGMTGRRLNYLFNQLRFYVSPSKLKKDLPESLQHLSKVYVGLNKTTKKYIYHNGRLMICP